MRTNTLFCQAKVAKIDNVTKLFKNTFYAAKNRRNKQSQTHNTCDVAKNRKNEQSPVPLILQIQNQAGLAHQHTDLLCLN